MSVHKINRKDKVLMQVVIVVKILSSVQYSKNEFNLKSILFPRKGGVWGGALVLVIGVIGYLVWTLSDHHCNSSKRKTLPEALLCNISV